MVLFIFDVVYFHLSSFIDVFHFVGVVSLSHFQATLPCHRHSTLGSKTHESLHQLWLLPRLLSIAFSFSSTVSATVLSGHFFTHRRFLPYTPSLHFWHISDILEHSQHFGTTCFYQGFTGSRQLLSWKLQGFILFLDTQTRPIC